MEISNDYYFIEQPENITEQKNVLYVAREEKNHGLLIFRK